MWLDLSPANKKIIMFGSVALVIGAIIFIWQISKMKPSQKPATSIGSSVVNNEKLTVIHDSPRNQGLEDLKIEVIAARTKAEDAERKANAATSQLLLLLSKNGGVLPKSPDANAQGGGQTAVPSPPPPVSLNSPLPSVDFTQDGVVPTDAIQQQGAKKAGINRGIGTWANKAPSDSVTKAEVPSITIPALSALEGVLLHGFNARTNASGSTTGGSIISANNVGAPFVTRIKGSAILPNGWRASELDSCFISGTGIGVLSTERANVIADRISCVDTKGRIFEAKVKGYGVDLDGIQGLSGTLVTKQGSALAKTALAGIASGLGAALTPTTTASINTGTTATGSSTPYTLPSGGLVAGTALGSGISNSMSQLSKFYLDYAKSIFPVIEVPSGTRITWVLQESVELTAMTVKPAKK